MTKREFVTDVLSLSEMNEVMGAIVDFLASKGANSVRAQFGFVAARDLRAEPQGEDGIVSLTLLRQRIDQGLDEGTIEWGGTSDFRFSTEEFDLEVVLCNDSDIHVASHDAASLMELGRQFATLGVRVYEDGSLVDLV